MRRIPGRTTAGLLTGFAAFAAALPLLAALYGVLGATQDQLRRGAVEAQESTARHVALRLQRGLAEQWRELEAMAAFAARELDQGPLQTRLDTARALNHRLA